MENQDVEPQPTAEEIAELGAVPVSVAAVRTGNTREVLVRGIQSGKYPGQIDSRGHYTMPEREVRRLEVQKRANELAEAVRVKAQAEREARVAAERDRKARLGASDNPVPPSLRDMSVGGGDS